jgi:hypothetical protein
MAVGKTKPCAAASRKGSSVYDRCPQTNVNSSLTGGIKAFRELQMKNRGLPDGRDKSKLSNGFLFSAGIGLVEIRASLIFSE